MSTTEGARRSGWLASPTSAGLPRLEAGDQLERATFHERYVAMPSRVRAELIERTVIMPSPVGVDHGAAHPLVMAWLVAYMAETPGCRALDNATVFLGDDSEPQPDACLVIAAERGGSTRVTPDGYLAGPPELVVEVAHSSEAYDLHQKRRDYERHGVREYVVVALRDRRVYWLRRGAGGAFEPLAPAPDGLFRCEVFGGLWLDPDALLDHDAAGLLTALRRGLASPEHAAMVARLAAPRA